MFVEVAQLFLGPFAMADLSLQMLGLIAQRLFGGALFGDVGMDADPFDDLAVGIRDRLRADQAVAPRAVMAADAMFEHEDRFGGDRGIPRRDGRIRILGMDGVRPTIAGIVFARLPGQRRPAGLLAGHLTIPRIGPQDAVDRLHRSAEAVVAATDRRFALRALFDVGHQNMDAQHVAIVTDAGDVPDVGAVEAAVAMRQTRSA
ncbi:hypothetical protein WR25_12763 [Diploscapter pachys]|uniref:Uncharacterized protein n=1 Tax=Diploscapter pachys TaxID=2018661 RepID=A0A2A2M3W0_9BILA|nr:hypothetical protein WR25_12763 [Diploscapter pachys]